MKKKRGKLTHTTSFSLFFLQPFISKWCPCQWCIIISQYCFKIQIPYERCCTTWQLEYVLYRICGIRLSSYDI